MVDADKTAIQKKNEAEAETPKAPSRIKTYALYGGIGLAIVAAAYVVTLKVVKPMFGPKAAVVETDQPTNDAPAVAEAHKSSDSAHGGEAKTDEYGAPVQKAAADDNIFMLNQIVVNPAGTGGTRFLSASIGFEVAKPAAADKLSEREAIVRDALITLLSSQTIPELSDFKQREKLRQLIRQRVQKLIGADEIAAVYFTEFVLQ